MPEDIAQLFLCDRLGVLHSGEDANHAQSSDACADFLLDFFEPPRNPGRLRPERWLEEEDWDAVARPRLLAAVFVGARRDRFAGAETSTTSTSESSSSLLA